VGVSSASHTTNQNFSFKSGMQWWSKAPVVMKRKACNIVSTNPGLQNDAKNISSISEAFQLLISNSGRYVH
jgi:hypothetical protein